MTETYPFKYFCIKHSGRYEVDPVGDCGETHLAATLSFFTPREEFLSLRSGFDPDGAENCRINPVTRFLIEGIFSFAVTFLRFSKSQYF